MDIASMTPEELEHELADCAHKCYKADIDYLTKDEFYRQKDDSRKAVFAAIVESIIAKTTAEKERLALVSEGWNKWIQDFGRIRSEAHEAKITKDNWLRRWETIRSILSSKNTSKRTGI